MKQMTITEFADYSAAVPKDKHEDYNRMLAFVESVVMEKCCRIICTDCHAIGAPVLEENAYWHHHPSGRNYPCRAEQIRLGLAKG